MPSLLAHGLCSPLGPADIAAAALRGGLSRARQLDWAPIVGYGEDAAPAVGHPVLDGDDERWSALASRAWTELGDPGPVDAVLLALPLPDPLRYGPEDGHAAALDALRPSLPPAPVEILAHGHAAPAAALVRAQTQLAGGAWRRVLLLAVDSLLDPGSLAWLASADRLRGPECSIGLCPGEGAAWWLLGPDATGGPAQVRAGFVPGAGARAPADDAGRWRQAAAGLEAPDRHWVDFTGEPWRERAWGWLLPDLGEIEPADAGPLWGDLGAAGALAAGSAALAQGGSHRIWSLAEDGAAGAIAISPGRGR